MAVGSRDGAALRGPAGAAAFWVVAAILVALRLVLAARAKVLYEIDHDMSVMASDAAAGRLPWSHPGYHYFPVWSWLLGLFQRFTPGGIALATSIRTFLSLVDVGIAALVARLASRIPGALPPRVAALAYLANPVAIWVGSVQGQFDGLALFFLLAAVLYTVSPRAHARGPWAGVLLGVSIAAKQVTLLHPLLWLRRREGRADAVAAYAVPLLTLLPYAAAWRTIAHSLLLYYSVPISYGLSELVLWDSRLGPAVGVLGLLASLAAIVWLREKELARSCLFLFLVILFLAPGLGSQYLLWPLPFGALFGGAPMILFSSATMLWIVGSYYRMPGSGQFFGQLIWLTVGLWLFFEARALAARAEPAAA